MSVYAELADGRRLEFPDGTNPQVIQSTVRKLMAQAPAQPTGPTEGMGEAMLIAAGRGTDKLVQGVRQAYNYATGDQAALDKMAETEADNDRAYKPLQEKFPIATGIAETAPAMAVFPMAGGASLVRAGVSAGLPSVLSYGTAEERLKRGATDAAFGAAGAKAGQLVARALKPAGVGVAGASDDALAAAERIGYKPTPAQISQSPGMASFENYLLRTPGSSGTMQKVANANQTALNQAAAKSVGQSADDVGESVLAAAKKGIREEFDRLQAITKPVIGDDFVNALAKIDSENAARGPFKSKHVDHLINKGLELASKGDLDGKAYKEIRTQLTNEALMMSKMGDETTAGAYREVRSALDKAARGSLPDAEQKAWDLVRKQWDDFKTLTKSNVAEAGNVSAARAASALRAKHPGFRTGAVNGPMADVARVGEAFKGVPNPTSGQLAQQMMFSNPVTGVPLYLGNKAAAAAYMSPLGQQYFSRGLLDVGETGRALLGRGGIQLGIPAGRGLLGVE